MALAFTWRGNGVDLTDLQVYPAFGPFTVTSGVPFVLKLHARLPASTHNLVSVVCSNGQSLTRLSPRPGVEWAAASSKTYIYGFIPTSSGSFTFAADWGATAVAEFSWLGLDWTGGHTADGIWGAIIPDSTVWVPSLANANSIALPVQACWDSQNALLGTFHIGTGAATGVAPKDPGGGHPVPTELGEAPAGVSGSMTMMAEYLVGGDDTIGCTWTGSTFSNGGHVLEVRAAGTTMPPVAADVIGTPVHTTSGTSGSPYGSVTPNANALLLLLLCHSANSNGTLRTISSIGGTLAATWSAVSGATKDWDPVVSGVQRALVQQAQLGATPGSGTILPAYSGTTTGDHVIALQVAGAKTSGPIAQVGVASGDAGIAPSASLPSAPGTDSGTLVFIGSDPGGVGDVLPGPGFEELDEGSYASPNSKVNVFWRHSAVQTGGGTLPVAGDWFAIIMEVAPPVSATNGTATPAAVARTTTVPSASSVGAGVSLGTSVVSTASVPTTAAAGAGLASPSSVARSASVPAATASTVTDVAATPATVSRTSTVPAATGQGSATATPAATTGTAALPGAVGVATATAQPASVSSQAAVPAATATAAGNGLATPSAVARTSSVGAAVGIGNAATTPAVVARTAAVPLVTVTTATNGVAGPATVAPVASVPAATGLGTGVALPSAVAPTASVPQATGVAAGNGTATPATVVRLASVPAVVGMGGAVGAAAVSSRGSSVPAVLALGTAVANPGVVARFATLPAALGTSGAVASAQGFAALGNVPLALALAGQPLDFEGPLTASGVVPGGMVATLQGGGPRGTLVGR